MLSWLHSRYQKYYWLYCYVVLYVPFQYSTLPEILFMGCGSHEMTRQLPFNYFRMLFTYPDIRVATKTNNIFAILCFCSITNGTVLLTAVWCTAWLVLVVSPCREPSLNWLPTRRKFSTSTTISASPSLDWQLTLGYSGRAHTRMLGWSGILSEAMCGDKDVCFLD